MCGSFCPHPRDHLRAPARLHPRGCAMLISLPSSTNAPPEHDTGYPRTIPRELSTAVERLHVCGW